ncbi:zf-TFIIB domain-containing protein [Rhizohabitans arisaemae]|uniref:TFIIB-type zinc ribbon-containing protein n=1 Tax=Rhizohabitans arisaemae TaxID=2720610 RepID=UPI0024B22748|nr:zf-TFIIB domain-containing protein [Rhizohabitans arisaemae]
MQCPKCHGNMRTYDRNGVHIDQCEMCRGIFLDYGELETLTRLESNVHQPPPAPQQHYGQAPPPPGYGQPGWGQPYHGHRKHGSFARLLFST